MPHRFAYIKWLEFLRKLKKIARSSMSGHSIALGAAIGFFIGLQPIMGLQMIVSATIATIVKANRLAAILPVWITNPATFIPIYGFNYWVGHKITGIGPSFEEYEAVLLHAEKIAGEQGVFEGLINASKHLASMGGAALLSLCIGCAIVGLICAIVSFPICVKVVDVVRLRREKKRNARHERVTREINKNNFN